MSNTREWSMQELFDYVYERDNELAILMKMLKKMVCSDHDHLIELTEVVDILNNKITKIEEKG